MWYFAVLPPFLASLPWIVCMCSYTTALVRGALLVPSAQNKRSPGARNDNGEQLDRGREKAGSRCAGYFLRYVAYFYRFYVFYTKYHPLLCLAEASRLGHQCVKSIVFKERMSQVASTTVLP